MSRLTKLLILLLFIGQGNSSRAQLLVSPHTGATSLAQKLVGDGVIISNATFTGNSLMAGFFNNRGGPNFTIDSGIVLTSGRAKTAGPGQFGVDGDGFTLAQNRLASTAWNLPGDFNLAAEIGSPPNSLHDACSLEFDFIPLGDSIKFRYVFGSEEYVPAYVCSFNDAFAFFISGPGITGLKNIALVPKTNIPVTIFNVNDVPGGGCPHNIPYYIDNLSNAHYVHDGHTTILTAMEKVQPCQTYHLKLVIADLGDFQFDSGVFIEAKSLTSNVIGITNLTQVDPATGLSYLVEGCMTGAFTISRPRKDPVPLVVNLSYAGSALNSIDVATLPTAVTIPANDSFVTVNVIPIIDNIPEGIEDLKIYALAGCVQALPTDSTLIQIRDYDILALTPDTAMLCKGGSVQLIASPGYAQYQWEPDPTLSSIITRDPVASPVNAGTTYICTASIGDCHARDSVFLRLKDLEFVSKSDINCANGATGQIRVAAGYEWARPVEFSLDGTNWQADSVFNNLIPGTYRVKIRDGLCMDSIPVTLVQAFPDLQLSNSTLQSSCTGGADGLITVSATGGNSLYSYSLDGINFQPLNTFNVTAGHYTVTVQDGNGCLATKPAVVTINNTVSADAGADGTICEGSGYLIPAIASGTTITWTPGNTLDDAARLQPTANPVTTTKYYLSVTSGVCAAVDSVMVFVNPAPIADAGGDLDICYGKRYNLDGSGGIRYQWTPSTYFVSSSTDQHPEVKAVTDISYSLMVTDIHNCSSLVPDVVKVKVTPAVKIFAGNDTIAAINQPVQLAVKELSNAGVVHWTWTPGHFLSDPGSNFPVATLPYNQRFIVTGTTANGCEGMDDILIKVYKGPEIYVPSAFTPNNDGLNDILNPVEVGIKELRFFRVFNRWGQVIYETRDPRKGWDGKINGVVQTTGTYVWMAEGIDYKGNIVIRKGTVTIIL